MGKKNRFATSKSAKHYHNWFKGNDNWNPGKVITYTKEEYERLKETESKGDND